MKSQIFVSIFLGSFFASSIGWTAIGGVSDGGGNAVVCRNNDQSIQSAVLLDLYEAEKILRLTIQPNDPHKTYLQIALEAAARVDAGGGGHSVTTISKSFTDGILSSRGFTIMPSISRTPHQIAVQRIAKDMNVIQGSSLRPIHDFDTIIIPRNCNIEQTAIYRDSTDDILVVGDIWDAFDNNNKAALLLHESLYGSLRGNGETTSDRARAAVGYAFSGANFPHILKDIPNTVTICGTEEEAPQYRFAVYPENGSMTLQFLLIEGQIPLSKTSVKVSMNSFPLGSLAEGNSGSVTIMNFSESLLDINKKLAVASDKNADGTSTISLGLVGSIVDSSKLFKVTCNKTHFQCNENGCQSSIAH